MTSPLTMRTAANARPALRWSIAVLVSAAIAISYLDRQTLPWAIKAIQADIPFSNEMKAGLDSAFLVTYGLMYIGGGWLLDRLGTRTGFLLIMIFWSLACASHGLAGGVVMLAASRLLLGMGGGGFPGGDARGGGMVSGKRPRDGHGDHQRGHGGGGGGGAAADRIGVDRGGVAGAGAVALGVFSHGRPGAVVDGVVVVVLSHAGNGFGGKWG
jgi:MFS family permease